LFVGYDSGFVSHHARPFHAKGSSGAESTGWSAHGSRAVTRLSLGGGTLASASRDATVALWRVHGGGGAPAEAGALQPPAFPAAVLRGHELTVSAVDVTPDGCAVASGSRDCSVRVWDAATAREACAPAHTPQNVVTCLQWARGSGQLPPQALLQGGEDLRVRLWDTRHGLLNEAGALEGFTYFPLSLDASADGWHVATSSKGFNGVGCEVRLWDLRALGGGSRASGASGARGSKALLRTYIGHSQDATAVVFLSDAGIASGSKDGTVRVWAQEEGAEHLVLPIPGASINSLAACKDGVAAGCAEAHGVALFPSIQKCS